MKTHTVRLEIATRERKDVATTYDWLSEELETARTSRNPKEIDQWACEIEAVADR